MDSKKRNRNAGNHPSYKERGMSDKAIAKKKRYDSEYQKSSERVKYRVGLNRKNRKMGKVGDGKDVSHVSDGSVVLESQSKNRARNGSNGKSTKKRPKY